MSDDPAVRALRLRHLRIGWWSLLVFLALGLGLEALHGFNTPAYLDAAYAARRLMWTLAHAHGTLLGLVHLGFAATVAALDGWRPAARRQASLWLTAAGVALPAGFFLGGVAVRGGDPHPLVLLVPAGGLALLVAVVVTAIAATRERADGAATPTEPRKKR